MDWSTQFQAKLPAIPAASMLISHNQGPVCVGRDGGALGGVPLLPLPLNLH